MRRRVEVRTPAKSATPPPLPSCPTAYSPASQAIPLKTSCPPLHSCPHRHDLVAGAAGGHAAPERELDGPTAVVADDHGPLLRGRKKC